MKPKRISENVFNELKSLDDLIHKMGTSKDGVKISGVPEPENFKSQLNDFREYLKKELPEFTEEEILKIDTNFQKIKKIYDWVNIDYYLIAMEYQLCKKNF